MYWVTPMLELFSVGRICKPFLFRKPHMIEDVQK